MSTATPTHIPRINHPFTPAGPARLTPPKGLPLPAEPAVTYFGPDLTAGQRQVYGHAQPQLFRMLDRRTPGATLAVVELLADLAEQAPAVDEVLSKERQRRRETAAARPTLALALGQNRKTP